MNRARLLNLASSVVLIALVIGLPIFRWFERREEEADRQAFEGEAGRAALASVSDLPTARLLSVRANRNGAACGWIELTPEIGAVPFRATAPVEPDESIFVTLPRLDVTDPVEWAKAVFAKQLTTTLCNHTDLGERLPTPANANRNSRADGPVLALWGQDGPEWAVIPVRGGGYLALRRQVGGGATISPVFPDRAAVERWTLADGAALAPSRDAQGAEGMRQFDTCLNRYEHGDPGQRTCFTGWDTARTGSAIHRPQQRSVHPREGGDPGLSGDPTV